METSAKTSRAAETRRGSNGRFSKITESKAVSLESKAKVIHTLPFPLLSMEMKVEQWRRLRGNLILWEYGVGGELYRYSEPLEKWTGRPYSKLSLHHCWRQIRQNWSRLTWSHHEKSGFFGKDNASGKNRRQPENTKYEMDLLHLKKATGTSLQELSRMVRTQWYGPHSFRGLPRVRADAMARNTHTK